MLLADVPNPPADATASISNCGRYRTIDAVLDGVLHRWRYANWRNDKGKLLSYHNYSTGSFDGYDFHWKRSDERQSIRQQEAHG